MTRRLILVLGLGLVAALGYMRRPVVSASPTAPPPALTTGETSSTSAPESAGQSAIGFRDPGHLAEHFQKHGAEFGARSPAEYLRLAQQLRDRPAGGSVLEATRRDGTVTRFDRHSGAFLAFDSHGIIRTFFRPNDGEAYFRRQLSREASQP
jgi:pyocin large subunit-like protein